MEKERGHPLDAHDVLSVAADLIKDRGAERDQAGGERSMAKAVAAFNALTGHSLSVEDGWEFMALLKLARKHGGSFKLDDYLDGAAYMALMAEEAIQKTVWETHGRG